MNRLPQVHGGDEDEQKWNDEACISFKETHHASPRDKTEAAEFNSENRDENTRFVTSKAGIKAARR